MMGDGDRTWPAERIADAHRWVREHPDQALRLVAAELVARRQVLTVTSEALRYEVGDGFDRAVEAAAGRLLDEEGERRRA